MSSEISKRDQNRKTVAMGVSNDASLEPRMLRVDPSTNRLLVDASVTVSGLPTAVTDGEAVDVADTGNLAVGTDGSNYQVIHTDSSGDLQVDVLTSALPSGAATSANQTDGSQKTKIVDGSGNVIGSTSNALDVNIATGYFSATSSLGTNSSNEASNSSYANWSTNTWTGTYEQNDYQYVVVSLQTDDAGGTLYFDFSPDGTNTNTFPVAGFTVDNGVHEFHAAVKSGRYFRARFVGTGTRTYFRLYTYYTNTKISPNSPLNLSLSADNDAEAVKAVHQVQYQTTPSSVADGNFDVPSITRHKQVRTRDQVSIDIQDCNDYTDFTVFNNDTSNLANSVNHQFGTGAITFDKVDGAGNTVYAGVYWTIASLDIQELFEDGGFVGLGAYLTSLTNVVRIILRLGTDASNYNEWRWEVEDLVANRWNRLRDATGDPDTYAGNGWNTADIDYGAVLVEFNSQSNTLAGIVIDNIHMVSGRVVEQEQLVSITSNVTGSKVDVTKISGTAAATNTGNADAGTQRVVLASNQPAVTVDLGANNDVTVTSGTVAATQSGTWTVQPGNTANTTAWKVDGSAVTQPVSYATTGSGTATGALRVELPTNGTGVISTVSTVTALTGGGIAHDSADSGNPHKIGIKAYSPDGTTPGTAVAELDRTDAKGDLDGRLLTNDEHPRWWSYHLNTSTAQTDTSVQSSPGAGFQIVITDIQFSNGSATAINMFLEEGASTIWGPVYLEAVNGRGYVWKGKKHVTAATALTLTTSSSTAHSVELLGYIQAV